MSEPPFDRVMFCTRCYELCLQRPDDAWHDCGLCLSNARDETLQRVPDQELEAVILAAFKLGGWHAVDAIVHRDLLCLGASGASIKYVGLYS